MRRFDAFFLRPDVLIVPITTTVFRRTTLIQALHDFDTVDAIHLAAAVENGCDTFMTHDARLSSFPDLTVEVLS